MAVATTRWMMSESSKHQFITKRNHTGSEAFINDWLGELLGTSKRSSRWQTLGAKMQSAEVCFVHDTCLEHQFQVLPLAVFEVGSTGLGGVSFYVADE